MAFQSRQYRLLWSRLTVFTLADVVLAFGLAWLWDEDNWVVAGLFILAVIWLIPLVLNLKVALYKAVWAFFTWSSTISIMKQELAEEKVPARSGALYGDLADYLGQIALDQTVPRRVSSYCAHTLGQQAAVGRYSMLDGLIVRMQAERALSEYIYEKAPSPGTTEDDIGGDSAWDDDDADETALDGDGAGLNEAQVEQELEVAMRIKGLRAVGEMSARNMHDADNPEKMRDHERDRYETNRDMIENLLIQLEDPFARYFSLHQFVELLMAGRETERAQLYFDEIDDEMIREQILEKHPDLA